MNDLHSHGDGARISGGSYNERHAGSMHNEYHHVQNLTMMQIAEFGFRPCPHCGVRFISNSTDYCGQCIRESQIALDREAFAERCWYAVGGFIGPLLVMDRLLQIPIGSALITALVPSFLSGALGPWAVQHLGQWLEEKLRR